MLVYDGNKYIFSYFQHQNFLLGNWKQVDDHYGLVFSVLPNVLLGAEIYL